MLIVTPRMKSNLLSLEERVNGECLSTTMRKKNPHGLVLRGRIHRSNNRMGESSLGIQMILKYSRGPGSRRSFSSHLYGIG